MEVTEIEAPLLLNVFYFDDCLVLCENALALTKSRKQFLVRFVLPVNSLLVQAFEPLGIALVAFVPLGCCAFPCCC